MKRVAVFGSGAGSNAANLIDQLNKGEAVKIVWVVSNKQDAGILTKAAERQVPATWLEPGRWEDGTLLKELTDRHIDLIVLAGFLKLVPSDIITQYKGRIINIHPALLPAFGGKGMYGSKVHEAVAAAGVKESGITVHHVTEQYDQGDIIFQKKILLPDNASPVEIEKLVRAMELKWFPEVVKEFAGKI